MYEFKHEAQRREKIFKVYLVLFFLTALANLYSLFIDYGVDTISQVRAITSLLFYIIVFYFGIRRNKRAEILIKFVVWINIFVLLIMVFALVFT